MGKKSGVMLRDSSKRDEELLRSQRFLSVPVFSNLHRLFFPVLEPEKELLDFSLGKVPKKAKTDYKSFPAS